MAHCYPHLNYGVPAQAGWHDDARSTFDDNASHLNDDRSYSDNMSDPIADMARSRRHSVVKLEEDYSASQWQGRPQSPTHPMRHYSTPNVNAVPERMVRMMSQPYGTTYGPAPGWPMNVGSGSSTPTLMYGPVVDTLPLSFNATTGTYPFQHEHSHSVAMSPQSSQGGWASANSDGSIKKCDDDDSPKVRAVPGMSIQRSDGTRKKNSRFEIPSGVNLDNIEDLIKNETNEEMKKELKQQKRLLRNRQAALESRSRKRCEMMALQTDKKKWMEEQKDLVDEISQLKVALEHDRNQMMQDRQQYETYIQSITYERDEAIRSRTLETAELRRQNNVLKDVVRDMERHQAGRSFSQTVDGLDTYSNDFTSFGNLDLGDDTWEDDFLVGSDDLRMDSDDSPQRQLTPRPLPVAHVAGSGPVTTATSSKGEEGFSWNTFYMCLLFGAFIASQPSTAPSNPTATNGAQSTGTMSLPALSEEYRAEANNVLKAVLAADDDAANAATSLSASNRPGPDPHLPFALPQSHQPSSLDVLSTHLTTPTRQQQIAAAFALTPAQYEHITNPEGLPTNHLTSHVDGREHPSAIQPHPASVNAVPKPSPLQTMIASMKAERDEFERRVGLGTRSRERSAILDRVPENVMQDLRRLVAEREGRQNADGH